MRIAISGTASQGKSTLIKDFLIEWPVFKSESSTYRDLIKNANLPHSKNATKDGQWKILNFMLDELQKYTPTDNVIFDRCPLDNLVYSLWCFENNVGDIDKEFIDKCIPIVRESLRHLDIIFFIPITRVAPVKIENDGLRESDAVYIKEIDNIFKALNMQYRLGLGKTPFFPTDDCPAVIEIFGNRQERIQMVKLYLNQNGECIGGDVNDPNNILNPNNLLMDQIGSILSDQKAIDKKEKAYKKEIKQIKEFVKKNKR
jgi:hypothetical protein